MRVAVPSSGRTLESPVDPRFGRSPYYIIIETDTMEYDVLNNTRMSAPGGVDAAQIVAAENIDVVLAGAIGPNSSKLLSQAGIKIFKGVRGSVREALYFSRRGVIGFFILGNSVMARKPDYCFTMLTSVSGMSNHSSPEINILNILII